MAAKQQPYTTLPEQGDNQQHLDNFPLQPSVNQGKLADYQPPQASYPPQQSGFQPSQASYPPQQGGYQSSQASYPPQQGSEAPQQASCPPQQGSDGPQQASYPLQQRPQQGGYSPQQAGYPPQQAGYPPQQAGYPPQQAGYPPQQVGYLSGQTSYRPPEADHFQQQGYSQPSPQQTQVINQQPGVMENTDHATFRDSSVRTVCPHCRVTVLTTTRYVPGLTACLCCFLFGIFACCCADEIMDVQHDCPLCKNKIAVYEREC